MMIPGLPIPVIRATIAGGFSITAGNLEDFVFGYISPSYAIAFGFYPIGSITNDAASGGGIVHGIASEASSNSLIVSDATPALSQITIDAAPYPLTLQDSGSGYTSYTFGGATQIIFDATTYAITLSE